MKEEIKTPPQCTGCGQVIWQGINETMIGTGILCSDCKALLNTQLGNKQ